MSRSGKSALFHLVMAACLIGSANGAHAKLRLPRIFSHRMVLQRDQEMPVWGWANSNATVTVTLADAKATVKANEKGHWRVKLPAMKAGGPHTFVVTAGPRSRITYKDVLVGDVWLCSGQSNMVYPIKGRWRVPNADEVIAAAKYPRIRRTGGYGWQSCSPNTVAKFSAVGFFFARKLHDELDRKVPIGILNLSYNGSTIESWMPPDAAGKGAGSRFKSRFGHILGYPIRGGVWYQGESNMSRAENYGAQLRRLITGWRRLWKQEELPVAVVQLPPYGKYGRRLPTMWTQQMSILDLPATGFVVTTDVGELDNIHPPRKQEVGERAALWALGTVYGKRDLVWSGPVMKSVAIQDGKAIVTFDHVGSGLVTRNEKPPSLFELAGSGGTFVPAKAAIDGHTVVLTSVKVPAPKKVRFGWTGVKFSNLINAEGLPARPFPAVPPSQKE